MNRIYGIPGLVVAVVLVWTSFGFVHGNIQMGRAFFSVGAVLSAACAFLLGIGYPGLAKTRKTWATALAVWLLAVVALLFKTGFFP